MLKVAEEQREHDTHSSVLVQSAHSVTCTWSLGERRELVP